MQLLAVLAATQVPPQKEHLESAMQALQVFLYSQGATQIPVLKPLLSH